MRERMFDLLRSQGDPRMAGNGKVFDEYLHSSETHRGFYERYMAYKNDGGKSSGAKQPVAGWVAETDFEAGPLD